MRRAVGIALLVFLIIAIAYFSGSFTGFFISSDSPARAARETAFVERVIDGDTFVLAGGERVRLLGVDTPEKGQKLYQEAKEFLERLAEGRQVSLEKDITERDKYGRLLRYVYVGEVFANRELVKEGYASVLLYEPDTKYAGLLLAEEAVVKEQGKRIWTFPPQCLGIFSLHYNAKGNDNENLNDEYVTFRNKCLSPLQLEGWLLAEKGNSTFLFPAVSVENKTYLTLHTGQGSGNGTDLFWGKSRAIWNNDGDSLRLWDAGGSLILSYEYPS